MSPTRVLSRSGGAVRERGLDQGRHALEHRLVSRIALGVALAELGDLPAGQLGVGSQEQRAPVWNGVNDAGSRARTS